MQKNIQVWGDSVLKGIVYDEDRKRFRILKDNALSLCEKISGCLFFNRSRMGMTAPQALTQMKLSPKDFENQLVLIEFGGNDCDYNWKEVAATPNAQHVPTTPFEQFKKTITDMVKLVRQYGGQPILTSLPPLSASRYLDWICNFYKLSKEAILSFLGDVQMIYRWQELYSLEISNLASALSCPYVELRESFLYASRGQDFLCQDGIHPNAAGHRIMANRLSDQLAKIGIAEEIN